MRAGIYLGPPRSHSNVWLRAVFFGAVAATLVHIGIDVRQRVQLEALRQRVESGGDASSASASAWTPAEAGRLWHLAAVSSSGAPTALRPSEVLSLIGETVPERVQLVSATLEPSGPEPSLLLEAVAESSDDVSAFERQLSASSRVSRTRLLEERRTPEGLVSIRLHVELFASELP